jgi:hypothetical protein
VIETPPHHNPTHDLEDWANPPNHNINNKKTESMALNFKNYERAERTELGTVAELIGKGGKIKLSPRNFADETKRVAVVLEQANGASDMVICSAELSKRLRSKEITLSNLIGFVVTEQLSASGELINVITLPTGGSMIEINVDDVKQTAYEPVSTFNADELVAF